METGSFLIRKLNQPTSCLMLQFKGKNTLNPIQARLFLPFKGPRGVFRDRLMISGTIKGNPMKLCTVIVLIEVHQNTKGNFQKYDL